MDANPVVLSYVATVSVPLPDADTFAQQAIDKAWPEILNFCAAVLGVLAVTYLIKAFSKS